MRVIPARAGRGRDLTALAVFLGTLSIVIVHAAVVPAAAQGVFPDGPGKDVTLLMCGTCHPAERSAAVRLTRDGWKGLIAKMTALGAQGTDADRSAVLDYLATNFKGEGVVPLNLNRATSVELESIAGFLRKESAAWIAWRAKRPCKALDDLRAVPGVDFTKIDKRRAHLVCF